MLIGKNLSGDLNVASARTYRRAVSGRFKYGVLFGGIDCLRQSWPEATCLFSVDKRNKTGMVASRHLEPSVDFPDYDRVRWRLLLSHDCCLEVLVVHQPRNLALRAKWEKQFLESRHKPRMLVVVERGADLLSKEGHEHRITVKRIQAHGYQATVEYMKAHECGAPLWLGKFVTIYVRNEGQFKNRPPFHLKRDDLGGRSCSNCLLPVGVPLSAWVWGPAK